MEDRLVVTNDFIEYRHEKVNQYNQRGRTDRKFQMDIDCELFEWTKLRAEEWYPHPSWMVDGITPEGRQVDVKFIQKYWNLSGSKITNIIQQRKYVHDFYFYEWIDRPKRPLEAGDLCEVRRVGILSYDEVADNIRPSFKAQGQYYLDARKLSNVPCEDGR